VSIPEHLGSGFGQLTTADEVLADIDLASKVVMISGGYSGIGLETTLAFQRAGAVVVVLARRTDVASEALGQLERVEIYEMDLSDLHSVESFANQWLATGRTIDIIINNAAIMAWPETRVGPGWEATFAINHLGHFVLVNRLKEALSPIGSRIVAVASSGHFLSDVRWDDLHFEHNYDWWQSYGQSKTANILFALHLDKLGAKLGIHAFSLHPGYIITPLQRHIPEKDKIEYGWRTPDGSLPEGFKTPQQGAATTAWAATSPLLDDHGGAYCQDCDIAVPYKDTGNFEHDMNVGGVKPYALDSDAAAKLWKISSELTGVDSFE